MHDNNKPASFVHLKHACSNCYYCQKVEAACPTCGKGSSDQEKCARFYFLLPILETSKCGCDYWESDE